MMLKSIQFVWERISIICLLTFLAHRAEIMEYARGTSAGGVHPLPEGVAQCEGIPRKSWMTKCVVLKNEAGVVVGKGICHNVSSDLIIDSDNQPLGDDRVGVQIAESLSEHDVPSDWMFQMRSWHIKRVFLNGASLYDHEQVNLFNLTSQAARRRSRLGARPYDNSRERRSTEKIPKKEALLSAESIRNVATRTCCSKSCLQPFSRDKIEALRSEMHVQGSVYHRKHRQLDVHKQIHRDANGKEMITLEGFEVCPKAWTTIMGLHRSSYYRYKADALVGKRAEQHGNQSTKKPRTHTLQGTAILRTLLESTADHMPHKSRTKEDGEKVVAMSFPSSFHWNSTLSEINDGNLQLGLKEVSSTGLSRIRRESFSEYSTKK